MEQGQFDGTAVVFLVRGLSSFRLLEFKNKGLGFKVSGIPIQARPSADREIGPRQMASH